MLCASLLKFLSQKPEVTRRSLIFHITTLAISLRPPKMSFFGTLGSKMKCNTLECGLEKRAQKGVADETVSTIKLGRKREDGSAKAIGVLYSGDCLSIRANKKHSLS